MFIVGVGMTAFGRSRGTVRSLAVQAASSALADSGADRSVIDCVLFANAFQGAIEGQHSIRGEAALWEFGLDGVPVINVDNACAGASTALHLAVAQVQAGMADIVLAVGAERMTDVDQAGVAAGFDGCRDISCAPESQLFLEGLTAPAAAGAQDAGNANRSVFMDIYAALTRFHMSKFGTTQRQLAAVAAKNHAHSVSNPLAQYQRAFTVDEVLAARSVVWPLTTPMCSPVSDGAAAAIVCSRSALATFREAAPVSVRASVLMSATRRQADDLDRHVGRRAAQRAYELARVGPRDIDVAEVHDATSFGEIQQCENLGFCDPGDGGKLAARGETSLGGRIPINPSGGLVSRGHPVGATGLAQIHELVAQLRGRAGARQVEGARLAIAENGGGLMGVEEAAVAITVLEAGGPNR